ncbi:daunorubicin resistance protein [Corynebacterium tuberculostearicum]|uniref:daunorubicin resistance protein n=1 Tax=Corynebacterium tuberculostearicum TaxID=38304 RepID=UPI003F5CC007|nr:daunorubicin resistance protein [Corynebacterium tuberculostearicum]
MDSGHTVICIDHNLAVLAHADHVIDLGPGAGSAGGQLVYGSSPVDLAQQRDSVTGRFLADALVSP